MVILGGGVVPHEVDSERLDNVLGPVTIMLVEIQNADALSQPSAFNASALTISPLKGPWQDSCFVYP